MKVIDASALLDLLLQQSGSAATVEAIADERRVHAPHLAETELLHALRRWVRREEISESRASEVLDDLVEMPIVFHAHAPLRTRVWSLRHRLSAYDATYLALAELLEASLLTADRGLAQAARESVPVVEAR